MLFKNRFFELNEIKPRLFECKIFGIDPSDQEIKEFLDVSDKILAENKRTATIYELSEMKFLKAEHRIAIGNWTKKNNDIIKKNTIAVGYKTDSVLGKMVLNGIFLIQKPVFPHLISTNSNELLKWVEEQMAKDLK